MIRLQLPKTASLHSGDPECLTGKFEWKEYP